MRRTLAISGVALAATALLGSGCAAAQQGPVSATQATGIRRAILAGDVNGALDECARTSQFANLRDDPSQQLDVALALAMAGFHEAALATLDRAEELGADRGLARWYAAEIFALAGETGISADLGKATAPPWFTADRAAFEQRFRKPDRKSTSASALYEYHVASTLDRNGARWSALEAHREAVAMRPDHPLPRAAYAGALDGVGAFGEAARQADEGIRAATRKGDARGREVLAQKRAAIDAHAKTPQAAQPAGGGNRNIVYGGGRHLSNDDLQSTGVNLRVGVMGKDGKSGSIDVGYSSVSLPKQGETPATTQENFTLGVLNRQPLGKRTARAEAFWTYGVRIGWATDDVFTYTYSIGLGTSNWLTPTLTYDLLLEAESTTMSVDGESSDPQAAIVWSVGLTHYFGGP